MEDIMIILLCNSSNSGQLHRITATGLYRCKYNTGIWK